jgi:hypothetical protein
VKRVLEVCLAALALAGAASPAEDSSFAGTWEGRLNGLPAVTLEIEDSGGSFAGSATFYVLKDEGEGKRIGGAARVDMRDVRAHDAVLEFQIALPGSGDVVRFRMTISGRDTAVLKRAAGNGQPELSVNLRRQVRV